VQSAPLPENEEHRIRKLQMYQILDTSAEEAFDRITRIVAEMIGVPIALVSLVDRERQWFKSKHGLDATETDRELAFCAHTILGDGVFEIENALDDERFFDNPLVANDPSIRFYAGAPLQTPDGYRLGTLCAVDNVPRKLTEQQRLLLQDMAAIVVDEMELRIALKQALNSADLQAKSIVLKDEFLANVTHELRTPLTSICGSLRLINSGAMGEIPGGFVEPLHIADRNADSLLTLINELLDIQKLSSGLMEYAFEPIDITQLTNEVCENVQGVGIARHVSVVLESNTPITISGDAKRIQQVITNILANAIKFSPDGSVVDVQVIKNANYACVTVTDQGPGVPNEFVPSLFDKFTQANRKADVSGTGLGLSICKTIVDAHQGTIGLVENSGTATAFRVELPIRQTVTPR